MSNAILDQLDELYRLRAEGKLTAEQLQARKRALLAGDTTPDRDPTPSRSAAAGASGTSPRDARTPAAGNKAATVRARAIPGAGSICPAFVIERKDAMTVIPNEVGLKEFLLQDIWYVFAVDPTPNGDIEAARRSWLVETCWAAMHTSSLKNSLLKAYPREPMWIARGWYASPHVTFGLGIGKPRLTAFLVESGSDPCKDWDLKTPWGVVLVQRRARLVQEVDDIVTAIAGQLGYRVTLTGKRIPWLV